MPNQDIERVRLFQQRIRAHAQAARAAQPDKDALSRDIMDRFLALPEFVSAQTVLVYVDVRAEVRTRHALPEMLGSGKSIGVPWCHERGELELFHLESLDELAAGSYGILEPRPDLRANTAKTVRVSELDLIMVPGVAFTPRGTRLGLGKGYYDRLLRHARPDAILAALAFECQLVDDIPTAPHDVPMDLVVTERAIYHGKGRTSILA